MQLNLMCLLSWNSISVCSGEQGYVGILWAANWVFPSLSMTSTLHSPMTSGLAAASLHLSNRMVTQDALVSRSDLSGE